MKLVTRLLSRLQSIRGNMSQVLSMNHRNLNYIYPNNERRHYPVADNKLTTKQLLQDTDILLPETYQVYGYFYELNNLQSDLEKHHDFVIKPAMGSGGGGIVVIAGRNTRSSTAGWFGMDGTVYSVDDLRKHISDIIFGVYSFGLRDQAIIEARVKQHPLVNQISPYGLADVRMILNQHRPILAMIRLATKHSHGTANLHQGAIGVGVNIDNGITHHATMHGNAITTHPDSGAGLIGIAIPFWDDIVATGIRIAQQTPLKYIGIDIAVSEDGPRLLEINVRPGIEIQNANATGMRRILEQKTRINR